jgi:hypothetical protein
MKAKAGAVQLLIRAAPAIGCSRKKAMNPPWLNAAINLLEEPGNVHEMGLKSI